MNSRRLTFVVFIYAVNTVRYPGVEVDDALDLAEQMEV